jgi:outer membrane immunogenic protein
MKRATTLGLGALALAGLTLPSAAADLGARPIGKAPIMAPPPVFSWTGCYIGGFVGGAFPERDVTNTDVGGPFGSVNALVAYNDGLNHSWITGLDSSFIGGGTLGCNYQWPGSSFVVGIEGEVGFLRMRGTAADPLSPALDTFAATKIGDWYGMITGRLGWAINTVLLYAKGGAAFIDVDHAVVDACNTGACGVGLVATTFSDTKTTWTAGGGVEWAFAPNWTVKAEYMFIALDEVDRSCGVIAAGPATGLTTCFTHDLGGIHTGKLGVNFKF